MNPNEFATNAQDVRIQSLCGMQRRHAEAILSFCQGAYRARSLIIVVRAGNPESLTLQGVEGHEPKPFSVKEKTRRSGRVRVTKDGPFFYSDYDLQGAYELRHTGDYVRFYVGNYVLPLTKDEVKAPATATIPIVRKPGGTASFAVKSREAPKTASFNALVRDALPAEKPIGTAASVDPVANPFLNAINQAVCRRFRDPDMFQHGTQDDWRVAGRPANEEITEEGVRKTLKDDCYLAFEHTGAVYLLPNVVALRRYYESRRGMTWIY